MTNPISLFGKAIMAGFLRLFTGCTYHHNYRAAGLWTDREYNCHQIYRCRRCGHEKYEGKS